MRRSAAARGYNSRWRKARATYLAHHPLCVMCAKENRVTAASVVDHIVPHKQDQRMFWDTANWQPLCKSHHDGTKQQIERRGYSAEIGGDGWPTDPQHPANR